MSAIKTTLRITTVAVATAVALGVAGPLASATEAERARTAETQAAAAEESGAPQMVESGPDERLGTLPANPSTQQLVAAMYPGDKAAQEAALAHLQQSPLLFGFWDTAWKVTKCVGAIGAFIAGNALLVTKATKFGGALKGAKLIVLAGNKEERIKLLAAIFGEVTGLTTVATQCG
ncbi:hypothetical protein [Streptomyces sp. NPDC059010]|uniref:hypothetical protein n=1 Tax=Streptomyces sp. NPDC059010 TaxID=3346695 RepID=UPI0036CD2585